MIPSAPFDRVADRYDHSRGLPPAAVEPVAQAIVKVTKATRETRFLEPGIGTGRIALPLVERGLDLVGVDVAEGMLAQLRAKIRRPDARLRLVVGDATALPFADGAFDVAISAHLLHLIPDWRRALAEMRRVVRRGGLLLECGERKPHPSPRDRLHSWWQEIAAAQGVCAAPPGARREEVLAALREQGAELEVVEAVRWEVTSTPTALVDEFAQRLWSPTWTLSEEQHAGAVAELRARVTAEFGDLERTLLWPTSFELVVARGWALGARGPARPGTRA